MPGLTSAKVGVKQGDGKKICCIGAQKRDKCNIFCMDCNGFGTSK